MVDRRRILPLEVGGVIQGLFGLLYLSFLLFCICLLATTSQHIPVDDSTVHIVWLQCTYVVVSEGQILLGPDPGSELCEREGEI